jgi:hypothetical protein
MATNKPAAAEITYGRLPRGVDYPDELRGATPLAREDVISIAAGNHLFIERPGKSWVPWAVKPSLIGAPTPLTFTRLYPHLRLVVDLFPSKENLSPEAKLRIAEEQAFKRALCEGQHIAYVALHEEELVDRGIFAQALAAIKDKTPITPTVTFESATTFDPTTDDLSALVGTKLYHAKAGPSLLPWAWRIINPTMPWAKEPLIFDRYYWTVPLVVDFFPSKATQLHKEAEKITGTVELKVKLCLANHTPYLVVWGGRLPPRAVLGKIFKRYAAQ